MIDSILNDIELRVLGCLIEKQITTPEYYPLTLNALTHASNQKNNRDPVVAFEEATVARGLEGLRNKKLVSTVTGTGIRVQKYNHCFDEVFELSRPEVTVLCLLMLRGPQTVGELRTRSGSMYNFESLADVETVLNTLATRNTRPLVGRLPRQTGQKEVRFCHMLSGLLPDTIPEPTLPPDPTLLQLRAEHERIDHLEGEIRSLTSRMTELQHQFDAFKKQFE